MTVPRTRHACPAVKPKLGASRGARIFERNPDGRMMRSPCLGVRRARTYVNDIRNRIPFAIKLARLLLIGVERERDLMITLSGLRLHRGKIQPTPRSRVQNAHQRALRVAI